MAMNSLHDLFADELKDLYSAETQLTKALPRMAKHAKNMELRTAFQQHLAETEDHVRRIEQICESLELKPRGKKCMAMEGLIEEGKELMQEEADPEVADAGMIGAAQKVEHYEIAAYGTARTHARRLGYTEAVDLLQQTLEEEAAADEKLTRIAEGGVNQEAAQAEGASQRPNDGRKSSR